MDKIMEYIKRNYNPVSVIVYGSYADGSNGPGSDFDALVISENYDIFHDTSYVDDIPLDLFVYPVSYFEGDFDCNAFLQIFDGEILIDTEQKGAALMARVLSYMNRLPCKTNEEIEAAISWCEKMLARTKRRDAEGMFRWHWVLIDSLEIFCDMMHHIYLGPKKTLKWMEESYPEAFACYKKALFELSERSLTNWIVYMKQMIPKR